MGASEETVTPPPEVSGPNYANNEKDVFDTNHHGAPATAADVVRDMKSPGVARIEAITSVMTLWDRIAIFSSLFLCAYAYSLSGTVRYSYQPTATASFDEHSVTAAINIISVVTGAATQPTAGKIADVFGRVELVILSTFFYVLGSLVEAVSKNGIAFAVGAAIYSIGYTMMLLLVEVIIGDITSTRARLLFSYVPALPFLINAWVSGDVSAAVLEATTWRWGYGMWCIIYPVCTLPLIISLSLVGRRAKKQGLLDNYMSSFQRLGARNFILELFWLLDVIGIILLVAALDLILVPFTLAGGFTSAWSTARVIAPLVIGFCLVPVFIIWELKAPHPLIPFRLMKDRGVWAPIMIAIFMMFAWGIQGDFLYTVLIVAFDFSIKTATRITNLYSFCSVVTGPIMGLVVYKIRRLKYLIMAGTALFMVAFGLQIRYRGSTADESGKVGVIAAQVVLGIAGGMFAYPAQASLQVGIAHEYLAVMTGVFLAMYNVGSAFGNAVSGALWTQIMPEKLEKYLGDATLAAAVYGDPFTQVALYPMGTPERTAIVSAYRETGKLLSITGICLCVPLIGLTFFLRNPRLNDEQTLAKDSASTTTSDSEAVEHDTADYHARV